MASEAPNKRIEWSRLLRLLYFSIIAAGVIIAVAITYRAILVPICIALFFTYLFAPLTSWLEVKFKGRRTIAVLFLILLLIATIALLVTSLWPVIYRQILGIIKLFPSTFDYLTAKIEPLKLLLVETGFIDLKTINSAIEEFNIFAQVSEQLTGVIEQLWSTTPSILGGAIDFFLVPLFLFFLLKDLPKLSRTLKKVIPVDLLVPMQHFQGHIDKTLRAVLKGQVTVALILAVLYMIGLSTVGLKSGLAIGAFAGICRIVPYLDVVVGVTLSFLVIISQNSGFGLLVGVGLVFLVVQTIDGTFITPRVIGERVGLHPGVVIASIIAFGDWFGFFGVLLAIPIVAIIMVVFDMIAPYYLVSPVYHGEESAKPQKSQEDQSD